MCIGIKQMSNYISVLEKWDYQCGREEVTDVRWIMLCKNTVILSLNWKNQYELMISFILDEKQIF